MADNAEASIRGQLVYRDNHISLYFDMDYSGIARYAIDSRELGHVLNDLARATKSYAELISPYDNRTDEQKRRATEPHYRNSWDTQPYIERRAGKPPFPRQAQLVLNQSRHAKLVEFGNGRSSDPYGHRIFPKLFDFLESYIP